MIRFVFIVIFVVAYMLLSLIMIPMCLLAGLFNRELRNEMALGTINIAFYCILFLAGVRPRYIGMQNVPKDKAVLYILNHRSIFDIILTYVKVPRPTGYVAKIEMSRIPVFSWWMKINNCLFLDRKDLRQGMRIIGEATKNVESGISMAIFPEGTRNKTDRTLLEFHGGSFKIAEKSGCYVVPVVLTHTDEIFEKHFPKVQAREVTISYLPAIDVAALDKEERRALPDKVRNDMEKEYNRLA